MTVHLTPNDILHRAAFACRVEYVVSWPPSVTTDDGVTHYNTGKTGIHILTGMPSAEYADDGDRRRVWVLVDGTIVDE